MKREAGQVAIVGAGPVGIEAALACVDRGLPFTVYEAGSGVGANLRAWGHVRLFTPWSMNVSERMRRHLPPDSLNREPEECPTGHELADRILEPIAGAPPLRDRFRTGVEVVAIGREGLSKHQEIGTGRREEHPFRLLLRDRDGGEWVERADVVVDSSGTYHHPNPVGDGGIPAPGEEALGGRIIRKIPDLEREGAQWAGRRILLVGAGHSAQTAVRDLARLGVSHPGTRVFWTVRESEPTWGAVPDDPLPARAELTASARELSAGGSPVVDFLPGRVVDRLEDGKGESRAAAADEIRVELRARDGSAQELAVDRILSLTGAVGDHRMYRQLQVHECYATQGPMKLAAALLGSADEDCLAQRSHGAETLTNPEPGFFLVGSKSFGSNNTFLMSVGWSQVEEVFGLL